MLESENHISEPTAARVLGVIWIWPSRCTSMRFGKRRLGGGHTRLGLLCLLLSVFLQQYQQRSQAPALWVLLGRTPCIHSVDIDCRRCGMVWNWEQWWLPDWESTFILMQSWHQWSPDFRRNRAPLMTWFWGVTLWVFWKWRVECVSLVFKAVLKPLTPWMYLFLLKLDTISSVPCIWTQSYRASTSVVYKIFPALTGTPSSFWICDYGSRCWDADCVCPWVTTVNRTLWSPLQWIWYTSENKPFI